MTESMDELQEAAEGRWVAGFLAGPTWTRYDSLPAQPGDAAPDLELPDTSGSRRRLSEFWAYNPALIIFMRHFGCSCLMERWEGLKDELDNYAEAGATCSRDLPGGAGAGAGGGHPARIPIPAPVRSGASRLSGVWPAGGPARADPP